MSTKTKGPALPARGKFPRSYAGLVALLPPRIIRDAAEAEAVASVLAGMAGTKMSDDQRAYVDLLLRLRADWDAAQRTPRGTTPAGLVRAIMDEHEMSQSAMADVLGITQGLVSKILKGERELSKDSIRRFCERFAISPAAMLGVEMMSGSYARGTDVAPANGSGLDVSVVPAKRSRALRDVNI